MGEWIKVEYMVSDKYYIVIWGVYGNLWNKFF